MTQNKILNHIVLDYVPPVTRPRRRASATFCPHSSFSPRLHCHETESGPHPLNYAEPQRRPGYTSRLFYRPADGPVCPNGRLPAMLPRNTGTRRSMDSSMGPYLDSGEGFSRRVMLVDSPEGARISRLTRNHLSPKQNARVRFKRQMHER